MKMTLMAWVAAGLISGTPLSAAPDLMPNRDYTVIDASKTRIGQPVVVEFFSYACVHCAAFMPYEKALKHSLPAGVYVHYVPVVFNRSWEAAARVYHALQQLGMESQVREALFKAIHTDHAGLSSVSDFAEYLHATQGIDAATFATLCNSTQTTQQLREDYALAMEMKVDRTPTFVVNGNFKAIVDPARGVDEHRVVDIVSRLAQEP